MVADHNDERAREAQRQYLREWRKRNPAKVRAYNEAYWKRKAQQMQQGGGEADAKADV